MRSNGPPCVAEGAAAEGAGKLVLLHQVNELAEQVLRIVGAGRGLGMILDAEQGQRAMAHALVGLVVEIEVRDLDVGGRERFRVHDEAVVLGGDFDFFGEKVLHRVIRAVVAELKFVGAAAESEAAELVSKADAEDGNAAEEFANRFNGVGNRLGVARAVAEKNAVGLEGEDVFGGSARGNDGDFAIMVSEKAEDVLLDAEIVGDDAETVGFARGSGFAQLIAPGRERKIDGAAVPVVGLFAGDAAGQLEAGHGGELARFGNEFLGGRAVGGDNATEGTDVADVADERAGINVPDDGNAVAGKIELSGFGGAPVGGE